MLPLLVGMVWVCYASPVVNFDQVQQTTISAQSISSDLLKQIFEASSIGYKSEYGIAVSTAELQIGYDDGTVTVTEVGFETWEIVYDGNPLIVGSEDFL